MLPTPHRMSSRRDFSAAVREGRRVGRKDIVIYGKTYAAVDGARVVVGTDEPASPTRQNHTTGGGSETSGLASFGGPRSGLIVSKAVGNAVARHAVARRLRSASMAVVADVNPTASIVIRALPGASAASTQELTTQLRSGLRRLGLLEGG